VYVHLVADLAVGEVQLLVEQREPVRVGERLAECRILAQRRSPRVTARARLALRASGERRRPGGDRGGPCEAPLPRRRERDRQRRRCLARTRRLHVCRSGPVARLTGHVQITPGRREALGVGVVALAQTRRVAGRAHVVPVLGRPGPVQLVGVRDRLVGVEVVPALATGRFGPRVPRDAEYLESTRPVPIGREGGSRCVVDPQQVLLQGVEAERIGDLVLANPAVRSVGVNDERVATALEARGHAVMCKAGAVEIAEHRLGCRDLDRAVVMRAAPALGLLGMALRARSPACKRRPFGLPGAREEPEKRAERGCPSHQTRASPSRTRSGHAGAGSCRR
jgi:hypothetical protein